MVNTSELLSALSKEYREANEKNHLVAPEKKSAISFSLILSDYPDIIIEKRNEKTGGAKYLCLLLSAGAMFIKSREPGKPDEMSKLTADSYADFTKTMEPISLPEGFWIKSIRRGKAFGSRLMDVLGNKDIFDMIKKRLIPEEVNLMVAPAKYEPEPIAPYQHSFSHFKKIYAEVVYARQKRALNLLVSAPAFCEEILTRWGMENLRDYLRTVEISLVEFPEISYYRGRYSGVRTELQRYASQVCMFERALTPGAE